MSSAKRRNISRNQFVDLMALGDESDESSSADSAIYENQHSDEEVSEPVPDSQGSRYFVNS